MPVVDYQVVNKQAQDWMSSYESNNQRGSESVRFSQCGDHWKPSIIASRELANKETLVFPVVKKFVQNFKAQIKQIEFSIGLWARNDDTDAAQTNTFRLLINHLVLAKQFVDKMEEVFGQCADFGYSFAEINYEYDNDETLCLSPTIRNHKNPSIGFWDKNAKSPYKTDGRFCGLRLKVSKDEFLTNLPEFKDNCDFLKPNENDFIKYWYREKEKAIFKLLKGGVYKRDDLITANDELATAEDTANPKSGLYKRKLEKKGFKTCIYYTKFCNEEQISDPVEFPTDRLPMPYHPAFTVSTDEGDETFAFSYDLEGVQQLLDYVHSQLATFIKNSTGDKWLLSPENISTPQQEEYAKNINQIEGAVVFTQSPDGAPIQRFQSADLPMAIVQYAQSLTQLANDISGSMFNPQNTQNVVVSGKALDKITDQMNVVQIPAIGAHIGFVNECASIIKSMIPKLYTEERILIVRKKDDSSQPIAINQPNGTGGLTNNIKDLNDSYIYELTSSATSTMVKENTIKYLQMMYAFAPQLFASTGDIFARNLDIPDSQELEMRFKATMDPMLIKYSQGEISDKEWQEYNKQQNQAKQQAMQLQMQHESLKLQETQAKTLKTQNEAQAVTMRAQGDMQKAQAATQDVAIKGQVAITNASVAQANTQINAQKVMGEQQQRGTQQAMNETKMQYEREKGAYEHADKMMGHALNLHSINTNSMPQLQPNDEDNSDDASAATNAE